MKKGSEMWKCYGISDMCERLCYVTKRLCYVKSDMCSRQNVMLLIGYEKNVTLLLCNV